MRKKCLVLCVAEIETRIKTLIVAIKGYKEEIIPNYEARIQWEGGGRKWRGFKGK